MSVKVRTAKVLSRKMQKTAVVVVERRAIDPIFHKFMKKVQKFKVHDERNECQPGDLVQIIETSPISKEKRWRVQKILKKAAVVEETVV